MPELSRFFGIIIRMYFEVGEQHHVPHLHAYYQNDVAIYSLDPIAQITGYLPTRQRRLVEAWAEFHQADLMAAWQQLQAGQKPVPIEPVREGRMYHPICRVVSFQIVAPFTLCVRFDDGVEQTIDFEPLLRGDMYRPLRDVAFFNQVQLDQEAHTLVWPNGADFDPATLHGWPTHIEAMIARAQQWELAHV